MKLVFYGNTLIDNIESHEEAFAKRTQVIEEFLPLGMDIHRTTSKLKLPRQIIHDFPSTLEPDSDLYIKIEKLKEYFGENLIRIDYIPISGDLHLLLTSYGEESLYLSNVLLGICGGVGDVTLDEEMVEVPADDFIQVEMQYPLLGMECATDKCLLRKGAYERLCVAAKSLPSGYKLKIWDAWRPFELQQELFEKYSAKIIRDFNLEDKSEEEKAEVINQFVAKPVKSKNLPPTHTTGGAVDLTIIDETGKELDMGSAFDEFSSRTNTSFYDDTNETVIKNNRRLLVEVMTKAGFVNLPSEWWHFDYGDRIWEQQTNIPAIYPGIF